MVKRVVRVALRLALSFAITMLLRKLLGPSAALANSIDDEIMNEDGAVLYDDSSPGMYDEELGIKLPAEMLIRKFVYAQLMKVQRVSPYLIILGILSASVWETRKREDARITAEYARIAEIEGRVEDSMEGKSQSDFISDQAKEIKKRNKDDDEDDDDDGDFDDDDDDDDDEDDDSDDDDDDDDSDDDDDDDDVKKKK